MLSRRQFLQSTPASAMLAQSRLSASRLDDMGVQLYTVRSILPKQPAQTLKAIRDIGYREIEATYAGLDRIWPAVESSGLKPLSIHLDNTLMNAGKEDDLARAIDQSKKWGFAFAVFPYLPPAERGGLEKIRVLTDKLNRAGEKCRAAGMRFCYHNHAFEFEPMEGSSGFQVMMDRLDKNLCGFELDCFWVSVAGHDPVLLQELSGRVPLVHLKDKMPGTPVMYKESVDRSTFKEVGSGSLDCKAILRGCGVGEGRALLRGAGPDTRRSGREPPGASASCRSRSIREALSGDHRLVDGVNLLCTSLILVYKSISVQSNSRCNLDQLRAILAWFVPDNSSWQRRRPEGLCCGEKLELSPHTKTRPKRL